MTKEEAINKSVEILENIHSMSGCTKIKEITALKIEAHNIIKNSDISYREAYSLMKNYSTSSGEFNLVMGRIRNTINAR